MRPVGEPSLSYGSTWVPDYMMFEPNIDYFSPLRMELFHLTKDISGDDYETAHDNMKLFLEKNGLHVRPDIAERYSFFINQMSKSNAQLAYDAIFADMNVIDKIKPILYKDPLILEMVMKWPQILTYIKRNTPEQVEFKKRIQERQTMRDNVPESTGNIGTMNWKRVEGFIGGKNIKKRYAKNTKGRRRQISRKR
jgi:hypothetical protein